MEAYRNSMAIPSLNNRNTKIECRRLLRHKKNMANLQLQMDDDDDDVIDDDRDDDRDDDSRHLITVV